MRLSRRDMLVGAAATAVAPALPNVAFAAPTPSFLPAFAVGTPGWHDWRVFFAATAERAKELWLADTGQQDPDASAGGAYPIEAQAVPHLGEVSAAEGIHMPSVSDCIAMGWDHNCDRCHRDVTCDGDNYLDIGGDCVCQECLTAQEVDAEDHDDFLNNFLNECYDVTYPAIFALFRPEDFAEECIVEALAEEADLHPDCLHLMPFQRVARPAPPAEGVSDA